MQSMSHIIASANKPKILAVFLLLLVLILLTAVLYAHKMRQQPVSLRAGSNQDTTVIEINGEKVRVPPNSYYSKTFYETGGKTSVTVHSTKTSNNASTGSANTYSTSSTNVSVNSTNSN